MIQLSAEEQQALDKELSPGEKLLWSGKPERRVVFHASDWYVIPFSLLWGGFAIVWEAGVSGMGPFAGKGGSSFFMQLWGIPFVVIGQYMIWGRFFYVAWKKERILYAITDQQVLVVVLAPRSKVISRSLRGLTDVTKEVREDGLGTIKFGETPPLWSSGRQQKTAAVDGLYLNSDVPVFVDVEQADTVAGLVKEAANKAAQGHAPLPSQMPRKPMFASFD